MNIGFWLGYTTWENDLATIIIIIMIITQSRCCQAQVHECWLFMQHGLSKNNRLYLVLQGLPSQPQSNFSCLNYFYGQVLTVVMGLRSSNRVGSTASARSNTFFLLGFHSHLLHGSVMLNLTRLIKNILLCVWELKTIHLKKNKRKWTGIWDKLKELQTFLSSLLAHEMTMRLPFFLAESTTSLVFSLISWKPVFENLPSDGSKHILWLWPSSYVPTFLLNNGEFWWYSLSLCSWLLSIQ